jgi:hypothetical protein
MRLTEPALVVFIQSGFIDNHCIAIQFQQARIVSAIDMARFYAGMGQT